ncbi:MAG: MerR family transcriptional regulator [Candidatus Omnitrophica bacterium]|nr:MerR family transcriptional regulator [Candidatus Omnitrophota bacterium]MBU1933102.1 MerR family transcriptional regulator [Candidatus Omnitrophota bacterium]
MTIEKNILTIDEVSKLFSLSKASINYYINMGLIDVSMRRGNKRFFEYDIIKHRMNTIQQLQEKGFLLRQIKEKIMQEKYREVSPR